MRRQPNADTNEFLQFCKEKSWSWGVISGYLQNAASQGKIIDLYCFVPDTIDTLSAFSFFQPDDRNQNGKLLLEKLMDNLTPRQRLDAVLSYSCVRKTPPCLLSISRFCNQQHEDFPRIIKLLNSDSRDLTIDSHSLLDRVTAPGWLERSEAVLQRCQNASPGDHRENFNRFFSEFPRSEIWRLFCDGTSQLVEGGWFGFVASAPNYLECMANGLIFLRESIRAPLTADLLVKLHASCTTGYLEIDDQSSWKIEPGFRSWGWGFGFGYYGSDSVRHLPTITLLGFRELMENSGLENGGYELRTSSSIRLEYDRTTNDSISRAAATVIGEYNQTIAHATTAHKKLLAIAKMVSSLERLHPFEDGNCRTICMLLVQRELIRNGFPPAILDDPNCIDGWSLQECVSLIMKGIDNCLAVQKGDAGRFGKTTDWLVEHGDKSHDCGPVGRYLGAAAFQASLSSRLSSMCDILDSAELGKPVEPKRTKAL